MRYAPHRELRPVLGTVCPRDAQTLVERYGRQARRIAKRYVPRARSASEPLDEDDLDAIALCALVEAWGRYEEREGYDDPMGSRFWFWAKRLIGWRLHDAIRILRVDEEHVLRVERETRAQSSRSAHVDRDLPFDHEALTWRAHLNGSEAQARCYRGQLSRWLDEASQLVLSPREAAVIAGLRRGETHRQIAESLQVSKTLVLRAHADALEALRADAQARGISGASFGTEDNA